MNKQKLLIITGPTGVGKTKLAMQIFDKYNCMLISADSMQIYVGCDIGTAKLSKELLNKYPHELIDIKHPNEEYSVAEFKENALNCINKAKQNNQLPIIVGGTGLYIESLLFDYSFQDSSKNQILREKYYNLANEKGNEFVYNLLLKKNTELAQKTHPNNLKRVVRYLEMLESQNNLDNSNFERQSNFDYNIIFLSKERDELYKLINSRVDEMMLEGLENEARNIYINYPNTQSATAIGYKEFFPYFKGEININEAIEKIKQHSRNYAKRQITWFKRYKNINFFDVNDEKLKLFIENNYSEFKK